MVSPTGLSSKEASTRLAKFGKNIVSNHVTTGWHILLRQIKSPFVYLLVGASFLAYWLQEYTDASMILLFTGFNIALGFYQEFRSESTARLLTSYLRRRSSVIRDGYLQEVFTEDIVPGDAIFLEPGDIVPADAKLIVSSHGLEVDESILTGESVPVDKTLGSHNLILAGTTITSGSGYAEVTKIGNASELGRIAAAAASTVRVSSFEKNIAKISSFTLKLITIIIFSTYFTNIAIKGTKSLLETTLFAIALAVSVIPEALPVVVTFSLSRGALKLAKSGSIVKRLSAIEDLGGIEILATDKTGTITENKLSVSNLLTLDRVATQSLKNYLSFSATGKDPIDLLLATLSDEKHEVIDEIRFDAERKRSTTLVKTDKDIFLITKGVPEEIWRLLKHQVSTKEKQWLENQELYGHRIIAVASQKLSKITTDLVDKETKSNLIGYISLSDSIKPTAHKAVEKARALNVEIKIISGDSKQVCFQIAKEVGLVTSLDQVISGPELSALDDHALHQAVASHTVFSRIGPLQKSHIIDILQEEHVVGFVGDGVNDAPALKSADVSLAVDHASDVAREAADIILKRKSLTTIIDGIEEGRIVFGNTAKYIKMTLAANLGNFFSVAIASLLIPYLPMLPIQILLVNLLSDFPMIAVAADTLDKQELAKPGSYDIRDIASISSVFGFVSSAFDLIFFAIFVRFSPPILQTGWFIESIVTELLFFFSIRSHMPLWRSAKPPRGIVLLSTSVILITIALTYTPFGHSSLGFVSLPPSLLILNLSLILVYLAATESVKLFYYRSR